jgi:hypothetical protein
MRRGGTGYAEAKKRVAIGASLSPETLDGSYRTICPMHHMHLDMLTSPANLSGSFRLLPFHRSKNVLCEDLAGYTVCLWHIIEHCSYNERQIRRWDYPCPLATISERSRPNNWFIEPLRTIQQPLLVTVLQPSFDGDARCQRGFNPILRNYLRTVPATLI